MLDKEAVIDQRSEKYWGNGQKATPTGRQATGIGSGYSALRQEQPLKIVNPTTSISAYSKSIPEGNTSTIIENRKIQLLPDGQKATKNGHEATPINGGYNSLRKKQSKQNNNQNENGQQ
jgi:hypothetical protein